jgi:hypothetical protein
MVTMALVLTGCTSSTLPSTTTITSTTKTVIHADLAQFRALAQQGLRKPFEARYRFIYPKGIGKGQLQDFRIWSQPAVGSDPEGFFVYEAPFKSGEWRYISGKHQYECLQAAPQKAWRCIGPVFPQSIGQFQEVEGYRLPMYLASIIRAISA